MSQLHTPILKAPFPYFGGKSRIAPEIWSRLGDVQNYVEPFFGSGATLLARPFDHVRKTETVNDLDGLLCNFWRAVQADPHAVAKAADWPIIESDLHARHAVLLEEFASLTARLEGDPDFYDVQLAGWWVWGVGASIGNNWCNGKGPWRRTQTKDGLQLLSSKSKTPGITRSLPRLSDGGSGIHRQFPGALEGQRAEGRTAYIQQTFEELGERLRHVRVSCGDWKRVVTPAVTVRNGVTGILLDPPYGIGSMDYAAGGNRSATAKECAAWAVENGDNPQMRIAYCGYEGAATFPDSWECLAWKTAGGYGGGMGGAADANRFRERVWFSPHCLNNEPLSTEAPASPS